MAQVITSDALMNGRFVCPGRVVFVCETRNSTGIAWSSEKYIKIPSVLEFRAERHNVGQTMKSGDTVANFTQNYTENVTKVQVLVSTLNISVLSNSSDATVTCRRTSDNNETDIDFEVIGKGQLTAIDVQFLI